MTSLEQILSYESLRLIEKMLFCKTTRLKKSVRGSKVYGQNYHRTLKIYEKAYNEVLEALEFYRSRI